MDKKKVIIIGAGLSGLTSGIYLLDNGFDVTIYEKHSIPGGELTGWVRDNTYIDGCAHWIVGTNKESSLYPLWNHIGAINEFTKTYHTEYFNKFDIDGEILTFYSDLDKLKEELLRISPIDKKQINRFIKGIRLYQYVKIPTKKPVDKMNPFEVMFFGIKMLPMVFRLLLYKHISVEEYAKKFKSKVIRESFLRIISKDYNVHSLFYIMQALSLNDADAIEGGSKSLALKIESTYKSLGGKIYYNTPVDKILIDKKKAYGIKLKNNNEIYSDYVVSSVDAHYLLNNLLESKIEDPYYMDRFRNRKNYPLNQCILASFNTELNLDNYPKMISFKINDLNIGTSIINSITVRNFSFDKTLNKNKTLLTVLIDANDSLYDYLKSLKKEEYKSYKENIGLKLKEEIEKYYNLSNGDINFIDLTTPITYERYCNAYRGSYMSFITTKRSKGLMRKGVIKHVNNLYIAGQWIMPPGGLPIALFSGKHAAYRIVKNEKLKFIDLDITNKANYKYRKLEVE